MIEWRYHGYAYGQTGLLYGTGFTRRDNLGLFDPEACLAAWPHEGREFCSFWYQDAAAWREADAAGQLGGVFPELEGRAGVLAWAEARAGWPWLGTTAEEVAAMDPADRVRALGLG